MTSRSRFGCQVIVETMNEAALTVDLDGTILFCNRLLGGRMKIKSVRGRGSTFSVVVPDTCWRQNKEFP